MARRLGVVTVPTTEDLENSSNTKNQNRGNDDDDDEAPDTPYLAVVRVSEEDKEAAHLKNSTFYDIVSVVVNGLSPAEAKARIAGAFPYKM